MTGRDTNRALAKIAYEGLFEQLATAMLQAAQPICASLAHPGMNADGRARSAPLDKVRFVPQAYSPHLVLVHTITAADGLEHKRLYDPATVGPRKAGGCPTAPADDLVKTAEIVAMEQVRM